MTKHLHVHFHRDAKHYSATRQTFERNVAKGVWKVLSGSGSTYTVQVAGELGGPYSRGNAGQTLIVSIQATPEEIKEEERKAHEALMARIKAGRTKDARFAGTLTGVTSRGKTVTITAAVNAPSHYEAGDKLKAAAAAKHGDLRNVVIRWEGGPSKLPGASLGARVAEMAGSEEE